MDRSALSAREVLVEGGLIVDTGSSLDVPADTEIIDLRGRILLPAFRDVHVHFLQTGIRALEFDGGEARSEKELLEQLREWVLDNGEVNGFGYSPPDDGNLPTRESLDGISSDIPVFLRRIDGHSSCVNSAALKILEGVIKDVDSVDYERGWLFDEANIEANRYFLARMSDEKLVRAANIVADIALSVGCGSIGALVPDKRWMELLLDLDLPVRIVPRLETLEPGEAAELGLSHVGGCIPMADGSFGSRTALLFEEYSDMPGCRGKAQIWQSELDLWMDKAASLGLKTAVHAIGDGGVEMALKSIERLKQEDRPRLPRIEHAELLTDDQIERIAEMGISLAIQPVFEELWGGPNRLYARRLGERWKRTNRYRDLLYAGVTLAGSSDSYITPIDPLRGIRAAINHPNPQQRVSLIEAIDMFTINAARAEGLDNESGSISPGKLADFVVLNENIFGKALETLVVEITIIGGKIVYKKGV